MAVICPLSSLGTKQAPVSMTTLVPWKSLMPQHENGEKGRLESREKRILQVAHPGPEP